MGQKVYWAWFNKRSKIMHCFTYRSSSTMCGIFLWSWDRRQEKNGKGRCKNCERALEN